MTTRLSLQAIDETRPNDTTQNNRRGIVHVNNKSTNRRTDEHHDPAEAVLSRMKQLEERCLSLEIQNSQLKLMSDDLASQHSRGAYGGGGYHSNKPLLTSGNSIHSRLSADIGSVCGTTGDSYEEDEHEGIRRQPLHQTERLVVFPSSNSHDDSSNKQPKSPEIPPPPRPYDPSPFPTMSTLDSVISELGDTTNFRRDTRLSMNNKPWCSVQSDITTEEFSLQSHDHPGLHRKHTGGSQASICNSVHSALNSRLHSLARTASEKFNLRDAFQQCSILGIKPETIAFQLRGRIRSGGSKFADPFCLDVADCLDQFPLEGCGELDPVSLATFCMPGGVKMRLVMRRALEGAERLGWVGKGSDRHLLLTFTDENGTVNHAVAITVMEELNPFPRYDSNTLLAELRLQRRKRAAAVLITRFLRKRIFKPPQLSSLETNPKTSLRKVLTKIKKARRKMRKEEEEESEEVAPLEVTRRGSEDSLISFDTNKHTRKTTSEDTYSSSASTIDAGYRILNGGKSHRFNRKKLMQKRQALAAKKNQPYRELGMEAYREMKRAEKLGEVCLVEKCYVIVGGKKGEQALLFAGLQQLVEEERESLLGRLRRISSSQESDVAVRPPRRGSMFAGTAPPQPLDLLMEQKRFGSDANIRLMEVTDEDGAELVEWNNEMHDRRQKLLSAMRSKLRLSSQQSRVTFPTGERQHARSQFQSVNIALSSQTPAIQLPLPLPQVASQYGLATLLLRTGPEPLLLSLQLLLVERSILVLGDNPIEVTSSSCALLELLQPFQWASTFVPLLPHSMLDVFASPVPFVAGMIAETDDEMETIMEDERTRQAIAGGMGVLKLSTGSLFVTSEYGISDTVVLNLYQTLSETLECLSSRLAHHASNQSSSLSNFKTFFTKGPTPAESLTLRSAQRTILQHNQTLTKNLPLHLDLGKSYNSFVASLVTSLKAQQKFREELVRTQHFSMYVEDQKEDLKSHMERMKGAMGYKVACWVYEMWIRKKKRRQKER